VRAGSAALDDEPRFAGLDRDAVVIRFVPPSFEVSRM
jgi:hypothetical protein